MAIFEGAGVALATPMKADGAIDFDKLKELVEFQIEGGTDAIIVCGTTGEASAMTHEEHIETIRFDCYLPVSGGREGRGGRLVSGFPLL